MVNGYPILPPGSGLQSAEVPPVKKTEPHTKVERIFNPAPGGGLRLHSAYKTGANGKILVWRRPAKSNPFACPDY